MELRKCHSCGGKMVPAERRERSTLFGLITTGATVYSCLDCGTRANILPPGTQALQAAGGVALIAFGLWTGQFLTAAIGVLLIVIAFVVPRRNPVITGDERQPQAQAHAEAAPQPRPQRTAARQPSVQPQAGFGRRS